MVTVNCALSLLPSHSFHYAETERTLTCGKSAGVVPRLAPIIWCVYPGPMGSVQEKHLHADAEALTSLRSEQLSELKADSLFLSRGETKPHGLSSGP